MEIVGKAMDSINAVIRGVKTTDTISGLEEFRKIEEEVAKFTKAADWVKKQDHSKFTTVKVTHTLHTIHECNMLIWYLGCALLWGDDAALEIDQYRILRM